MESRESLFRKEREVSTVLVIDIGAGTQDCLVWIPGERMENAVKLVLPSPTRIAAKRLQKGTEERRCIFLDGVEMGGGAVTRALKAHLEQGLPAYATPDAAGTFHDNLEYVRRMGVEIVEEPPRESCLRISLGDLELEPFWRLLDALEIERPSRLAVAVQDHGFSPEVSNRETRFAYWNAFLAGGGRLEALLHDTPPPRNRRMRAVHSVRPDALLMDTGPAAILGALLDEWAAARKGGGVTVVNVGNAHTLAYLIREDRCYGIYEHHTACLTPEKMWEHLHRFREGSLSHREVFEDQGHGVAYSPHQSAPFREAPVVVTGPQRALLASKPVHMAAPFGDMMLCGCYGLLKEALSRWGWNGMWGE